MAIAIVLTVEIIAAVKVLTIGVLPIRQTIVLLHFERSEKMANAALGIACQGCSNVPIGKTATSRALSL